MHLEPLELRAHLSADLIDGLLRINGTANADTITVTLHSHQYRVSINGATSTFKASKVEQVKVRGFAGADNTQLFGRISIPIGVFGERGNDTIHGSDGRDLIDGGGGNDSIDGGNNDDFLIGGNGNDTLVDHSGDDAFFAGNGKNHLDSKDGDGGDELHSHNQKDQIRRDKHDALNPTRVENVPPADFDFFDDDVFIDFSPPDSNSGENPTTQPTTGPTTEPTTQPTDPDPGSDPDFDSGADLDLGDDFGDF